MSTLPETQSPKTKIATLVLADGSRFIGKSFGAEKSTSGECVFHTSMVGYPESITDPSYRSQILIFSFPLIGNYGVPPPTVDEYGLPTFFEGPSIHLAGIIVSEYCEVPSHWNSNKTISEWLKDNNIPAIYDIDTRALIKVIREKGSLAGKIIVGDDEDKVPFVDIGKRNLVAEVSTKEVITYTPKVVKKKVIVVDCGVKMNQLRCLLKRGLQLKVVPWDYDFTKEDDWDGLFVSNGPGDPSYCEVTIANIRKAMAIVPPKPIFGVCMGNQLIGLAAGAKTYKMAYGNRGLNQPCVDLKTQRCHITAQNHGYVLDNDTVTLTGEWENFFVNANDNTNEGIIHKTKPFFSVQFHPEAKAGPQDSEYLFDMFVAFLEGTEVASPLTKAIQFTKPKVHKILVLGSGGLSIGQAGEFDYSGSQCIKALKEEGIVTILINPNVATVQTSPGLADKVYFLPVTPEYVTKVIKNEQPDGILVTFGGQTALNCGIELYKNGVLAEHGVQVLGTPIDSIIATEDRGIFAEKLNEINEKIAPSMACHSVDECIKSAETIGYPVIVRAAFCLGGLGSGFAHNREELIALVAEALASSEQVLVEKSLYGWKEIEYEVVRDAADNCITVCNMENMDPMGIHTGESIVVAPSQTLTDDEYQMLRCTAIKTVRHLGVVGECNIQYALNPHSQEYCIIEVNARLSRSSALASKATGYPLAFVAAKLALGFTLPILRNSVTKRTTACFEPSLDYVVVKMPRWDLKKFDRVSTKINSSMKSVGEVMSIGRKFEEAIQKAIRTVLDGSVDGLQPGLVPVSEEELEAPTDKRILVLASALKEGYTVDRLHDLTKIDRWFLSKLKNIIDYEAVLTKHQANIPYDIFRYAKQIGFSDKQIARCIGSTETTVRQLRKEKNIIPYVKHIDTVAGEFPAQNNYLYMTYNASEDDIKITDKAYVVLGSGAYRIGSSVEFDLCAVGCIRTIRSLGQKSILVNYNPETVSTDYDECDYLFFEELSLERVLDIYERQPTSGVVISVGGQIPNNLALPLSRHNVKIVGTHPDMIDNAENRYKFSRMLDTIGVDQPQWKELTNIEDIVTFCETVGYPCLVRPSYVLSGAAMNVVNSGADLTTFLTEAAAVSREHPVVISKFIEMAKEIEVDAVADGGEVVLYAVSEHVENAGVHSGDATIICPAVDLDEDTINKVVLTTRKIASVLNVTGPFNIQYLAKANEIKVIECNLRASRSFPFVSKTLNIDFIELATKVVLGVPYKSPEIPRLDYVGVKVPQFSFIRLKGADPVLGVEMASTGEVACFGKTKGEAYIKGLLATGFKLPKQNILLSIGSFKEKHEFLPAAKKLVEAGYTLFGTPGTADFMHENGVKIQVLDWHAENNDATSAVGSITKHLMGQTIDLFVNLPSKNKFRRPATFMSRGYLLRRVAVDFSVPLITNIKCAKLFAESVGFAKSKRELGYYDIRTSNRITVLPGLIDVHVHLREPGATHKEDFDTGTAAALAGGFTIVGAMPNTSPPITDGESLGLASSLAARKARCDYGIFLGASVANSHMTPNLASQVFGLKMYLEDTFGSLVIGNDLSLWKSHIANWPGHYPICVHATGQRLSAVLMLGMLHDKHIHVCHVSFKEDIELIRDAKEKGLKVTCETTPHHLFFAEKDLSSMGQGFRAVKPHIGTEQDKEALWKNIDIIDVIATDHAPHTIEEKSGANPPPGYPGLETSLPLMLTAVQQGKLTLEQLVDRMHHNPRRIFSLPEQPDTYVEVDLDEEWVIPSKLPHSKCGWTPFAGMRVKGAVRRVVLRGEIVYLDGKVLGKPGSGHDVRKVDVTEVSEKKAEKNTQQSQSVFKPMVVSMKSPTKLGLANKPTFHLQPVDKELLGSFNGRHILKVSQFSRKDLHYLFTVAHEMRSNTKRFGSIKLLKGKILAALFFEPSTRTACSFNTAMERLGGSVMQVNVQQSCVVKGESLQDTLRTLESYFDAVVIRHASADMSEVAKTCTKPVLNAGDGLGEHPTQALLDVFTIREELGTVNGLTVTIVGDLKNNRMVHSLARILALYQGVKIYYVSPDLLRMPADVLAELNQKGIEQRELSSLDEILPHTNVLYVTRIPKERFTDVTVYEQVKDSYNITPTTLRKAPENMIIMHPLPRHTEISADVDSDPRAAYFRQAENGMYIRMALLAMALGKA